MNRLAMVIVLASGCHWIDELQHPAEPAVEPPLGHADWVEGSLHIGREERGPDGPVLRAAFWDEAPPGARNDWFRTTLTGPGGTEVLEYPDFTVWKAEWPAGTYKLTWKQLGKVVTEREFKVAMLPNGFGKPFPTVVPEGSPHVISPKDGDLYTFLPVNVATPGYTVAAVWVKDHRVVRSAATVMSTSPLFEMRELGEYRRLDISTKEVSDLGTGTVMLFINGAGLYGAWAWTKQQDVGALSLPAVTPEPSDLALARAAARAKSNELEVRSDPLGGPRSEELACAVATDPAARNEFLAYRQSAFQGGVDDMKANDESARADNDDRLTQRQRAKLRKDAAQRHDYAGGAAMREGSHLAQAMKLSRKFEKGCLAALNVPTMPALPAR